MKSLINFLFSYGYLGWKSRLALDDYRYHEGRMTLAFLLFGLPFMALFVVLLYALALGGIPTLEAIKQLAVTPAFIAFTVCLVVFGAATVYLFVNWVRLAILRIHDFDRSGWWVLSIFALGGADILISSYLLPNLDQFVALQSLALLALLLVSGKAKPNRFGTVETNSTDAKARWVRYVPLAFFFTVWVYGLYTMLTEVPQAPLASSIDAATLEAAIANAQTVNATSALPVSDTAPALPATPVSPTVNQ
jgi:uncharacterized membrane protein YhaH (DUF805 family)